MNAVRALLRRHAVVPLALLLAVAVTASVSGVRHYTVRPGDTLSEIAARYHTSVAALVRLNRLPGNGDLIYAGSTLRLPGHAHHRHATRHHAHHHARTHVVLRSYVVRPGDSLYAIAARFHASWKAIARRNHLPSSLVVMVGQRLQIPQRVRASTTPTLGRGFRGHVIPSREAVAAMIRATAARWHVDPRLALGISYEEAGFNQHMVSRVGAIGAMQVMPATGRWLSTYVVHRPLDLYAARDNVTAGVALLSVLLRETNGNLRLTAAGYYQGLSSVRSRGMYDDTKQYVANVLALRNRF
ncbi:MAG TPA: LysM peptidoglycan-binding domain-containing protein [Mycobacteriales bacterium]|nr:LysM peptidoglycan-binding domain-containing protein [Mycobacteriales bacterium]